MKIAFLILVCFVSLLCVSGFVNAATITWTGGGADNLASTTANWSSNEAPRNGDGVVFDTSSSKNCTWDLAVILVSFAINSGYTGKITLEVNLTISDDFIWTGMGEDNLASNPANWSRNAVPGDGYSVVFNGTSLKDCVWDISVSPSSLSMDSTYSGTVTLNTGLSIVGDLSVKGGVLNLNDKTLGIDGNLLIGTNGTIYSMSSIITVKGDWINYGFFDTGTSTVILNGLNQTLYGSTTFYNLVKSITLADTLYFEARSTQTILNNFILQGASNNLLSLRSTNDGQYWYIDPQGTRSISFVDIKDSHNINPTIVVITDFVDSGNNQNVHFGNECVCINSPVVLSEAKNLYFPILANRTNRELMRQVTRVYRRQAC